MNPQCLALPGTCLPNSSAKSPRPHSHHHCLMAGTCNEVGILWLNVPAPHLQRGTSLGRASDPKKLSGDSAELEGVEDPHPKLLHLAVGDHPSPAWECLVLPKIGSGSPKRGAFSGIHESLLLHYLMLGRLLEMCISLVVRMNSTELEGLLTITPRITGSHSQRKQTFCLH